MRPGTAFKQLWRPGPPPRTSPGSLPPAPPAHHRLPSKEHGTRCQCVPALRASTSTPGVAARARARHLDSRGPPPLTPARFPRLIQVESQVTPPFCKLPFTPGPGSPVVHSRGRSGGLSLNSKPSRVAEPSQPPARASHPQPGLRGAEATSADESRSALCGDSFGRSVPAPSRGGPGRESRLHRAVPSAAAGFADARRAPARLASPAR